MLHSKLSPSSAHRWIPCPGSIQAEAGVPDVTTSFAEEGTAAHTLAAVCLEEMCNAEEKRGHSFNGFLVDDEMIENVQVYLDYVNRLTDECELHLVEQRVEMGDINKDMFGTVDYSAYGRRILHVTDLKYGKGVQVYAFKNKQAMLYAHGALRRWSHLLAPDDIDLIRLHIVQPRLDNIDTYDITLEELDAFVQGEAKPAAREAMGKGARFNPGPVQCRFCKVKASCDALRDFSLNMVAGEFEDLTELPDLEPRPMGSLTYSELAVVLEYLPLVTDWADAVKKMATGLLMSGKEIPNWKLVEGRGKRVWTDEEQAEKELVLELGDKAYERKLLTAPKAEKALGKKSFSTFEDLVVKQPGAPTLVPQTDKRPALTASQCSGSFANLDANESTGD